MNPHATIEAVERLVDGGSEGWTARLAGRHPHRAHAEQFLAYARSNRIDLHAFWACRDADGHIAASTLAVPNPGRTAILFASTPRNADEIAVHARLIDAAAKDITTERADLAQVLLDPRETRNQDAYRRAGFTVLANLGYMERPLPRRALPLSLPEGMTITPFDPAGRAELEAVLDATYVDTLDCPGLRGLRQTEDILNGHQGTGEFDPALWLILRERGRGIGVILLNRSPASQTVELVYIGLAPEARGRGSGRLLLRAGMNRTVGGPERAITLAVDDDNAPAIALYRREGFKRVLERVALIRASHTDG